MVFKAFFLVHVHVHVQQKKPPLRLPGWCRTRASCYSSTTVTTRHSAMVPTATSPSPQPAIVKIRRVDALIIFILLPAATPFAARLYALAALLLLC